MIAAAVFDALGTLFDLGRAEDGAELAQTLHHATALTLLDEFVPLSQLAEAVDEQLVARISGAAPYDDAERALRTLADAQLPAFVLTNGSEAQTRERLAEGGLADLVENVFSVEAVRRYKPDHAPYEH